MPATERLALLALTPALALSLGLAPEPAQADWQARHYSLQLRPDFQAQSLDGRARVQLWQRGAGESVLPLQSPGLDIRSVRHEGQVLPLAREAGQWQLRLPPALAMRETLTLDISYQAPAAEGLVFGPDHVYTAYHSCNWLPCFGSELERVGLDLSLDLPPGMDSLASGAAVKDPVEPGPHEQHWRQALAYPIYTLGFAAGRFSRVDVAPPVAGQPALRYLGVVDEQEALREKFATTPAMLAFFSDKAGVALPQPVYSQLLLPGGVAQEASSYALIGRRMLDPILQTPHEDWVIAHELAHQWWGNLLSCAEWRDFWLNEGITSFMTAAWKQQRWGQAAYQRELGLFQRSWQRAREAGYDKPLSWPGDYPSLTLKRAIHYSKGALFMVALREELGEAAFWAGLRLYTQKHAGTRVRAVDLQQAMEDSGGRSLAALFEHWVWPAQTAAPSP